MTLDEARELADLLREQLLDDEEAEYAHAEREGIRLDSALCPDCPDPGLCASMSECAGRAEGALSDAPSPFPEWDAVE